MGGAGGPAATAGAGFRLRTEEGMSRMSYAVLVDDNYHYMDKDARYTHGEFETIEAAIAACRHIVDDYLKSAYEPGMTAEALYASYKSFGEDPWVSGPGDVSFSAWTYAEQRCTEICAGAA